MSKKDLLFSVTAADCDWSYTKGTGAGGQKRNKTSSAVHCHHRASGARGYSEASRSQLDNKREAFRKMAESEEFRNWHRLEVNRRTGVLAEIERRVEQELRKVRVEIREDGVWTEWKEENERTN
jgi:protein subunit release factor B